MNDDENNILPFVRQQQEPPPPDASPPAVEQAEPPPKLGRIRQRGVLALLEQLQFQGATFREVGQYLNLNHGQSSGVLSGLHRAGKVACLAEQRERAKVYLLPKYVSGRQTVEPKHNASYHLLEQAMHLLALKADKPPCGHPDPLADCWNCLALQMVASFEDHKEGGRG